MTHAQKLPLKLLGPTADITCCRRASARLWSRRRRRGIMLATKRAWRAAMALADQQCIPCRGGVPPLPRERIDALLGELDRGWSLTSSGHLLRTYEFRDFANALAFANRVGQIAEEQGHHPDLHVGWGRCGVEIWTHKIDGLTESDFFLAAKADRAFRD
jgi:4a-hydroxytetrahydrobiopterin dehydratase